MSKTVFKRVRLSYPIVDVVHKEYLLEVDESVDDETLIEIVEAYKASGNLNPFLLAVFISAVLSMEQTPAIRKNIHTITERLERFYFHFLSPYRIVMLRGWLGM